MQKNTDIILSVHSFERFIMKLKPEIEKKIDELLKKMTVREKLGQLTQLHTDHDIEPSVEERLRRGELGGFLAAGGTWDNEEYAKELRDRLNMLQKIAVEESRLGIPAIFGRDVIHGHRIVYPDALASAASFNPELVENCYSAIAEEASSEGLHWVFSPMLDLSRDPRWGRCVEGVGEDPYLASKMAGAMVRGFQGEDTENLKSKHHVAACAKHYVGYGAAEGGRDYQKAELSDYTLRNFYLNAFNAAVDAGCLSIMSSFNEISGQPVTSSHYLLTDVLRDEMGFRGFVVSDDWSVRQLVNQAVAETELDAAAMAMTAGVDMDMDDLVYIDNGERAIEEGKLSIDVLDEAVRRVLRVKFEIGLFDDPYGHENDYDIDAHIALSRKIAGESAVLLKNNGVLPLKKTGNITVVGDFYNNKFDNAGAWACDLSPSRFVSVEEGIRDVAPEVHVRSSTSSDSRVKVWNEKQLDSSDTVVIVMGESLMFEGEASGVQSLEIPDEQVNDILNAKRLGKKVVAVMLYGRPMALGKVDAFLDAVIWGMHLGTETGHAIADILFGDVNPSGKLSMTLPRVTGQVPLYYNSQKTCRFVDEYYGRVNAFENYRDGLGTPSYPFGHGLSYTTFEYGEPTAKEIKIPLSEIENGKTFEIVTRVTNTGERDGKESVQCYVRDEFASATRPLRELKGFEKIDLNAGESREVTIKLGERELGFWHFDKKFYAERGKFKVYVGGSSYADKCVEIEIV